MYRVNEVNGNAGSVVRSKEMIGKVMKLITERVRSQPFPPVQKDEAQVPQSTVETGHNATMFGWERGRATFLPPGALRLNCQGLRSIRPGSFSWIQMTNKRKDPYPKLVSGESTTSL